MGENGKFIVDLLQWGVVAFTGIGGVLLTRKTSNNEAENMIITQLQTEFDKRDRRENEMLERFDRLEQINSKLREENLELMLRTNKIGLEKSNIEATLLLRIKRLESENLELESIITGLNEEIARYKESIEKSVDNELA